MSRANTSGSSSTGLAPTWTSGVFNVLSSVASNFYGPVTFYSSVVYSAVTSFVDMIVTGNFTANGTAGFNSSVAFEGNDGDVQFYGAPNFYAVPISAALNGDLSLGSTISNGAAGIRFNDGSRQTTAMIALTPNTTYNFASITTDANGTISSVASGTDPQTYTLPAAVAYYPYLSTSDLADIGLNINFGNGTDWNTDYYTNPPTPPNHNNNSNFFTIRIDASCQTVPDHGANQAAPPHYPVNPYGWYAWTCYVNVYPAQAYSAALYNSENVRTTEFCLDNTINAPGNVGSGQYGNIYVNDNTMPESLPYGRFFWTYNQSFAIAPPIYINPITNGITIGFTNMYNTADGTYYSTNVCLGVTVTLLNPGNHADTISSSSFNVRNFTF